ncbi:hypothetical protein ACJX0J_027860, partial [Zea mays]
DTGDHYAEQAPHILHVNTKSSLSGETVNWLVIIKHTKILAEVLLFTRSIFHLLCELLWGAFASCECAGRSTHGELFGVALEVAWASLIFHFSRFFSFYVWFDLIFKNYIKTQENHKIKNTKLHIIYDIFYYTF